jgi:hypothetical protein
VKTVSQFPSWQQGTVIVIREGGTKPCRSNSASSSSYIETFANYDSSSSSSSSSVAVYWESCKPSFQCVDLGSETVVDKKVMEWETKINKGDVVSSKE